VTAAATSRLINTVLGSTLDDEAITYYYPGNRPIATYMGGEAFRPIS
tara:strand:+ start:81 stop:221 length:141 start_codon:yes stop_codon:yes gene_type:complete